tara:strand:- start:1566 stop:1832 length:267 start_codon:yes stop_codon:yes gene_type:complete
MDNNNTLKTEAEIKNEDMLKNCVLSTCVSCEQQLRLLQLRLISFDDLIQGVTDTINSAQAELKKLNAVQEAHANANQKEIFKKKSDDK